MPVINNASPIFRGRFALIRPKMEAAAVVHFSPWEPGLLSLALYTALVLGLLALLLFLAGWLGEHKKTPEKLRPYECGVIPTGPARLRFPVAFYLVAIFFLIFDVEAAYIFAWAVAFSPLGWLGWLQISFFIIILLFALFYLWQKGGLDWRPAASNIRVTPEI